MGEFLSLTAVRTVAMFEETAVKTGDYTPFLTIDPVTMIATLLNTLILFLVLKHFLFKPVNKILDERKEKVEKTYKEADDKLTEASRLETEYTE